MNPEGRPDVGQGMVVVVVAVVMLLAFDALYMIFEVTDAMDVYEKFPMRVVVIVMDAFVIVVLVAMHDGAVPWKVPDKQEYSVGVPR